VLVAAAVPISVGLRGWAFSERHFAVMAAVKRTFSKVALSSDRKTRNELSGFDVSASAAAPRILVGNGDELVEMVSAAVTGIFVDRHHEDSPWAQDNPRHEPCALGKNGRGKGPDFGPVSSVLRR
jgi:hypothetical protein